MLESIDSVMQFDHDPEQTEISFNLDNGNDFLIQPSQSKKKLEITIKNKLQESVNRITTMCMTQLDQLQKKNSVVEKKLRELR